MRMTSRRMASGGIINIVVMLILVVWLYGTPMLAERRLGLPHYPCRVALRAWYSSYSHDGIKTCWRQDRRLWRSFLISLDTHCARHNRDFSAALSAHQLWRLQREGKNIFLLSNGRGNNSMADKVLVTLKTLQIK